MPVLSPLSLVLLAALTLGLGVSFFFPFLWNTVLLSYGALALLMLLDVLISPGKSALKIVRRIPQRLSLADENECFLDIENRGGSIFRGSVGENAPADFQLRNLVWSVRLKKGEKKSLRYGITPFERGEYTFPSVTVYAAGTLRLVNRTWHLPVTSAVKVYPSYQQVRKYQLVTKRKNLEMIGRKRQRKYGEGREFESLREYTTDDEYRKINWKATARRGKPIVSQFQIERSQNVILMLDAGRMMRSLSGSMSRLDYAVNTALMLSFICVHKEDNVGLVVFGSGITHFLPPRRGIAQLNRINEALYNIRHEFAEPHYREAFQYLRRKVSRRSLVILITDLIDDRASQVLIREFTRLYPQHLPLCISLRDNLLEQAALQIPASSAEATEMAVAQNLLEERLRALRHLRANGVLTLDTLPQHLTADAINKYVDIKAKSLI